MDRFLDVRGRLGYETSAALQAAGITSVVCDNTLENTPPLPYAIVTLSFGGTITNSLGCVADLVSGGMELEVHSKKRLGSSQGEDAAFDVLQAWANLNRQMAGPVRIRTTGHQGPITVPPGADGEHVHRVSCRFESRLPVGAASE